jgi:prefoldin subunit 5
MDRIIDRINEIEDLINQHQYSIYLLEEEKEELLDELTELKREQHQAENISWRQMKL